MTKHFTPRPYQKDMIEFMISTSRCALWAGMGTGKTSATLTAVDTLHTFMEDMYPMLVVAPLRVAQSTWPDEVTKWAHLNHLKVSVVTGDKKKRMAALAEDAHIYTTNYEQLEWLVDLYGKKWPFKTVVADELTRLKSFRVRQGGSRAKALGSIAFKYVKRFIGLTGTPAPNGVKDLHGQIWFIDQGQRLGRSYTAFTDRWFKTGWDGYSLQVLPGAQDEIEEKLKDICLTIDGADHFDLREPIINKIYIDLPPKARKIYNDMEKTMFMELEAGDVEAFGAAARTMKTLQIAQGACYIDEKAETWETVHDEKIKALESVIEEANGMPVLVAYNFRSDRERLLRAFPSGKLLDKEPSTITKWNKGQIPILFAHPASAGHGLNLQDGSNIICFFAHNWNLEEYQQILERLGPVRQMQAGHDRPVFVHHIIARDTVEEQVLERLETKADVQTLLMAAMKRAKKITKE